MTVSSTINRIQHAGNGVTATFAYNFKIFDENDLILILTDSSGAETTKTVNTDYTVSGVGLEAGGNVVCTSFTPATGETLTILRELDLVQETDLMPNDPLPAETLEEVFDRAVMISQQLGEAIGRALVLKKSSQYSALSTLPDPEANKLLSWNAAGDDLENRGAADIPLTSVTTFMQGLLDDPDAAAARATLDAARGAAFNLEHSAAGTHTDVTLGSCSDFLAEHSAAGVHDSVRLVNLIPNAGLDVWSRSALAQGTTGRQTDYESGADFVINGAFSDNADGWTPTDCTLSVAAAGESGNCLIITRTGGSLQYALQALAGLTIGKLYKLTAWVYSGSSGNEAFFIRVLGAASANLGTTSGTTSAAWVEYSVIFVATRTNDQVLLCKNTATAGTMKFDTVSVYEVNPGCVGADTYAPDWWTKTTTLDLLRVQDDTTHCVGFYGTQAIKGADTAEYLNAFGQVYNLVQHYSLFRGRTVTFGCWVFSVSAGDNVKLQINDSGGATESAFVAADTLTWIEVTRTCGASITSFTPRVLFDGDTGDVAYISQPMLVFGPSIGEGNYCPPAPRPLMLESSFTFFSFNNVTVSSDVTVYFEADSSGKLPKTALGIHFYGNAVSPATTARYLFILAASASQCNLAMTCLEANKAHYVSGPIYLTPADGRISATRNDTWTNVSLTGKGVIV